MPDIGVRNFAGKINCPNPFWLASAPPTNTGEMIMRAFDAGWGGAVWKTIGEPVVNVSSRYSATDWNGQRIMGFNNIELISDRTVEQNLTEMAEVKKRYPKNAVIASLMVASNREAWHEVVTRAEDAGADGLELNFGCPHGMSERGMGAAVGQVPEYCEQITRWVMEAAKIPVIMKLTPNITNIVLPARAGVAAGANALSLINTINSIVGADLETLELTPSIAGKGGHGGYAGPAVKPIALNMLAALGTDEIVGKSGIPISGMGGIATWQDAAQFLLLGASSLQVCTAVMHYGFRVIEDLCDGLSNWMNDKGFKTVADVCGHSLHRVSDFKNFDLSYRAVARIDASKCIKCDLCYVACNDTAHQCIDLVSPQGVLVEPRAYNIRSNGKDQAIATRPQPVVREADCVGCRLCYNVCPVDDCIQMVEVPSGRSEVTWSELTENQTQVTEDWETMKAYRERVGIHIH